MLNEIIENELNKFMDDPRRQLNEDVTVANEAISAVLKNLDGSNRELGEVSYIVDAFKELDLATI